MSRIKQIEWQPRCAEHGGTDLLGPTPHPCRECGKLTSRALRVTA